MINWLIKAVVVVLVIIIIFACLTVICVIKTALRKYDDRRKQ